MLSDMESADQNGQAPGLESRGAAVSGSRSTEDVSAGGFCTEWFPGEGRHVSADEIGTRRRNPDCASLETNSFFWPTRQMHERR